MSEKRNLPENVSSNVCCVSSALCSFSVFGVCSVFFSPRVFIKMPPKKSSAPAKPAAKSAAPAPKAAAKPAKVAEKKKVSKSLAKSSKGAKAKALTAQGKVKKGNFQKRVRKIRTTATFHRPHTKILPRAPKCQRFSLPKRNPLDKFSIVKYPLTTESAMKKIEDNNTLVFVVALKASKQQIKAAVKSLFNIDVKQVNTLIRPDGEKKAYVKLTPDYDALDVANKIGII